MKGNYFPSHNLLLLDGYQLFNESFACFLEQVYVLSLYNKIDDKVIIKSNLKIKTLLNSCLRDTINLKFCTAKKFVKDSNIYCNIAIYFNLKYINNNCEIFNYLNQNTIYKEINKNIKLFAKKKLYFFLDKENNYIQFNTDNICTCNIVTGKIKETLNIINFNLS